MWFRYCGKCCKKCVLVHLWSKGESKQSHFSHFHSETVFKLLSKITFSLVFPVKIFPPFFDQYWQWHPVTISDFDYIVVMAKTSSQHHPNIYRNLKKKRLLIRSVLTCVLCVLSLSWANKLPPNIQVTTTLNKKRQPDELRKSTQPNFFTRLLKRLRCLIVFSTDVLTQRNSKSYSR